MTTNLYIDGESALGRFGVRVTRGGYNGLLAYPSLREPEANDWPEEDGIEVDLTDPKLEPREVLLSLMTTTDSGQMDLVAYLSDPGYHTFSVPSLGREWRLRLSEQPSSNNHRRWATFTLKLIEDTPVRPEVVTPDPGMSLPDSRYRLDDVHFSTYGVVIDVARSALLRSPAAKLNMNRTVSTVDGRIYDADQLNFQSKEVTFKCHFNAVSMEAFWGCHDAFLEALTRSGERALYTEEIGKAYPCYYKGASGFKIIRMDGPVVVEFNLTMVFTSFRLYETDYFLATEAGDWLITEDENYFIDMK